MNLVGFEHLDKLKSLTHPLSISLAPGFPQRSEFFSHSELIMSSSIYSVKAEVREFYPFPCQIFLFLKVDVKRNQLPREKKRKQVDPFLVAVPKHLFVLGTKMGQATFFYPPVAI